ncbi:MAG: diaminopimelate epimerase [Alphaproteobacteria bacterium]
MSAISFTKMHGLGNDFVIIDARHTPVTVSAQAARAICDRHTGVGCDQLIVIEKARANGAAGFMHIRNSDGSSSAACGNATRCVAALFMAESGRDEAAIETAAGLLRAERRGDLVSTDLGAARTDWRDIPLRQDTDTLHLPIASGPLTDGAACSVGNPHATFFVDDARAIDLSQHGPVLEHDDLFPERANIGVVQVLAPDRIRIRVWERGAGITSACGTGASAAVVSGHRRGVCGRTVTAELDGGELEIIWRESDGHVLMTGPVATSFTGVFDAKDLAP